MKIINLTDKTVNVTTPIGIVSIRPSGTICHIEEFTSLDYTDQNIQFYKIEYGEVINLPDTAYDTKYIVSDEIRVIYKWRTDLISPIHAARQGDKVIYAGFVGF